MNKEIRRFEIQELRVLETNDKKTIGGYAAVFNVRSENLGIFSPIYEEIRKGAFSDSISNGDVRAFWNHNVDIPLGRTKNGSLRLHEDQHGLGFELDLADTQAGRDAFTSIKRGDVSAMSFGFKVRKSEWDFGKEENAPAIRTLLDVELFEVSPVAFPAYPQTDVSARNLDDLAQKARDEMQKIQAEADKAVALAQRAETLKTERLSKLVRAEKIAKLQSKIFRY